MSLSSLKTVDRLALILDSFSTEQPSWSLSELSAHVALPRSTLHRFLTSLESHGILRRESPGKRWWLGCRLFSWGALAAQSTRLPDIARPIMSDLVAATGETAILTIYDGQDVVCLDRVESRHSVRLTLQPGTRRPAHAGASSKILMAYLPEEEIQKIIRDKGLPKLCTNTLTDPDELMAELTRIRERGYAESYEETDPGAWGIAASIHDLKGGLVGAIGIAGPTSRFSNEVGHQWVVLCRDAAERISALFGKGGSADGAAQSQN